MLGLRRTSVIGIAVTLGAIGIGGGGALAARRTSEVPATVTPAGTITACVGKANGHIRIVSQASSCRRSETVMTWDAAGAGGTTAATALITLTLPNGETLTGGDPAGPTFEIKDWSFGVENPTTIGSATGGAGAGKIKFDEFTITKPVDTASPKLFQVCATGGHFKQVTIVVRRPGTNITWVTYELETVFITSIQTQSTDANGDETPTEKVTFAYGKLTITDAPISGPTVSVGWDQIANSLL
jgi:type VI secretion system secreted protein Hcp